MLDAVGRHFAEHPKRLGAVVSEISGKKHLSHVQPRAGHEVRAQPRVHLERVLEMSRRLIPAVEDGLEDTQERGH